MARMRGPATITTESETGGPPVPSIRTAPIIAFWSDSSGGLQPARSKAARAGMPIFSEGPNTHPSCQKRSRIGRCSMKLRSAALWPVRTPVTTSLLGFSEPAGVGDQLDAVEGTFAVYVPALFQLVERTGLGVGFCSVHPLSVGVKDHLPLYAT